MEKVIISSKRNNTTIRHFKRRKSLAKQHPVVLEAISTLALLLPIMRDQMKTISTQRKAIDALLSLRCNEDDLP